MKTFVVAGTYQESKDWIAKNYQERVALGDQQVSVQDYKYVSHADDVKGYTDPHGVFIGNWMGRPDILEIVEALLMRSTAPNAALGKIYKDLKPKVRPTPKKLSGTTYQSVINDAADEFAKHIDQEVLGEIMKKINGGLINR